MNNPETSELNPQSDLIARTISVGVFTLNGKSSLDNDDPQKIRNILMSNTSYISYGQDKISLSCTEDSQKNLNIIITQRDDNLDFIIDENKKDAVIMDPRKADIGQKRQTIQRIKILFINDGRSFCGICLCESRDGFGKYFSVFNDWLDEIQNTSKEGLSYNLKAYNSVDIESLDTIIKDGVSGIDLSLTSITFDDYSKLRDTLLNLDHTTLSDAQQIDMRAKFNQTSITDRKISFRAELIDTHNDTGLSNILNTLKNIQNRISRRKPKHKNAEGYYGNFKLKNPKTGEWVALFDFVLKFKFYCELEVGCDRKTVANTSDKYFFDEVFPEFKKNFNLTKSVDSEIIKKISYFNQ